MKTLKSLSLAAALAASAAGLALAPAAAAMTVQPVVVDLATSGRGMSQVVTVQNTFATPLPVEMRIQGLTFDDKGAHGDNHDPGDLLVFPPSALIQPGQTQTFRVQYVGDPALAKSRHYYVTVAQLPVKLPQGQSALQILYNFQVLVSVAPPNQRPDLHVVAAEIGHDGQGHPVPVISVNNDSNAHGYLSLGQLRIVEKDQTGRQIFARTIPGPEIQQTIGFGLITAGQTRKITVPVVLPSEGGNVEAQFAPQSQR